MKPTREQELQWAFEYVCIVLGMLLTLVALVVGATLVGIWPSIVRTLA